MIIDPAGEDRRLHRRDPRLRKSLYPNVQITPRCSDRLFAVDLTARIISAVPIRQNAVAALLHIGNYKLSASLLSSDTRMIRRQ